MLSARPAFHDHDTAVARFLDPVSGRNGEVRFPDALGCDAVVGDAFGEERLAYRVRTPVRQTLVVLLRPDGIGMADDVDMGHLPLFRGRYGLGDDGKCLG